MCELKVKERLSTVQPIMSGKILITNKNGFTLMELMIVLLLLSLLASIVTPMITKSINRAKESSLKEDLFIMRKAIDDYYADKGQYPPELEVLVEERYVRKIPVDPLTGEPWVLVRNESEDAEVEDDGVMDLHTQAEGSGIDGTPYQEW